MKRVSVLTVLLVFAFFLSGCISPWGMNMRTQQERKVEQSEASEAVASSETTYKGPLESKIQKELSLEVSGEGAVGAIIEAKPEKRERPIEELLMEYHHAQNKIAQAEAKDKVEEEASSIQRNPYTLVLVGAGLILIPVGIWLMWKLIKNTPVGSALKLIGQGADTVIESLRAKLAQEDDPAKKSVIKDLIIEAEHNRNMATNGENSH